MRPESTPIWRHSPWPLIQTWSAGRELNPRMQVLQTCALTASPPALFEQLTMVSRDWP